MKNGLIPVLFVAGFVTGMAVLDFWLPETMRTAAQAPLPMVRTEAQVPAREPGAAGLRVASGDGAEVRGPASAPGRSELIAGLRPSEIRTWWLLRKQKEEQFLSKGDQFWSNQDDRAPQDRFDPRVARDGTGDYKGQLTYETPESHEKRVYTFKLKLNDLEQASDRNRLVMDSEKNGSYAVNFGFKYIGTDSGANALNVVWSNLDEAQRLELSAFAFKLPATLPVDQVSQLELYGLDESMTWKKVGQVELRRFVKDKALKSARQGQ